MDLAALQTDWNDLGERDAFWAILSDRDKADHAWDPEAFFATGVTWVAQVMEVVESIKPDLTRGTALDFGCGAGRVTQALCRYFDECYGVDIAPAMVELADRFNRCGDRCHYAVNAAADLRIFGDDSFDFVYSQIVLQHIPPEYTVGYIREFVRVLAPEGLITFQLPSERIPVEAAVIGNRSRAWGALPNEAFRAHVEMLNCPIFQDAGSQLILDVRVENRSDFTWPALPGLDGRYHVKVVNRWLDQEGTILAPIDGATLLPIDLPPGGVADVPIVITAPEVPGVYVLEVDLAQNVVGLFGERGATSHSFPVEVRPPTHRASEPDEDRIQMYAIERSTVEDVIGESGGECVDIQENALAGEHWLSYTYYVTKR